MKILTHGLFKLICLQVWSIQHQLQKNLLKWFFKIQENLLPLPKKQMKLACLNAYTRENKIPKNLTNTNSDLTNGIASEKSKK